MTSDLLMQLEKKVEHAVEVIELLRLQVEELEEENLALKAEHEKWRSDLSSLINRFDQLDLNQDQFFDKSSESKSDDKITREETETNYEAV